MSRGSEIGMTILSFTGYARLGLTVGLTLYRGGKSVEYVKYILQLPSEAQYSILVSERSVGW